MLTVENLSFVKNDRIIFRDLGFSLFLSTALIVTGKNGSGKTSLLKILAGIFKESSGKILWSNQDIADFRSDFNGDLQFLGHKNFLKPDLTVQENLHFYASLTDSVEAVESSLHLFGLTGFANKKIKDLSAGWQKRAMLAKLACCPATIWILDEPTVNLDEEGRNLFYDLVKTKLENQGIVVIATHDEKLHKLGSVLKMEDYS